MNRNGIVRRLDPLGRVVIPKEWRDELKLEEGTPLEIVKVGERFTISRYTPGCYCCGAPGTYQYNSLKLCGKCISNFKEAANE